MRIQIREDGGRAVCQVPYRGAAFVETARECPYCGSGRVRGEGKRREVGHDTITCPAHCYDCDEPRGRLVVRVSTIFGIEEDERVAQRARVY